MKVSFHEVPYLKIQANVFQSMKHRAFHRAFMNAPSSGQCTLVPLYNQSCRPLLHPQLRFIRSFNLGMACSVQWQFFKKSSWLHSDVILWILQAMLRRFMNELGAPSSTSTSLFSCTGLQQITLWFNETTFCIMPQM